jgi:hypothetical protein
VQAEWNDLGPALSSGSGRPSDRYRKATRRVGIALWNPRQVAEPRKHKRADNEPSGSCNGHLLPDSDDGAGHSAGSGPGDFNLPPPICSVVVLAGRSSTYWSPGGCCRSADLHKPKRAGLGFQANGQGNGPSGQNQSAESLRMRSLSGALVMPRLPAQAPHDKPHQQHCVSDGYGKYEKLRN